MKILSIIIPVYNAKDNISRCLESIIPQMKRDYELILIDDGSTDESLRILQNYEKKFDFIRIVNQNNCGVAITRNNGIKLSKGKYICFIDNDDYVEQGYFETFLYAIKEKELDIVVGGYKRVSENKLLFQIKPKQSEWYLLMNVAPWAKIFRRDFLIENNIRFLDYGIGEDNYFSILAYMKTTKIDIIDYIGYNWYYNDSSISNTKQKGFNKVIDPLYLLNKLVEITGVKEDIYKYYYLRYVIWYLLFSGKNVTDKDFINEYKRLFNWLERHDIKIKYPLFSTIFRGEPLKNKVIIKLFVIIHKLNLMTIFSKIYC